MNDLFHFLRKEVEKADLVNRSRHVAAIILKGEIVSLGYSRIKTHPLQKKFSSRPERLYLHAEIDAIVKVKDKSILKDCDLYVLRLSKGNNIGNSKPCEGCQQAIKHYGFKNVYWSTDGHYNWMRS